MSIIQAQADEWFSRTTMALTARYPGPIPVGVRYVEFASTLAIHFGQASSVAIREIIVPYTRAERLIDGRPPTDDELGVPADVLDKCVERSIDLLAPIFAEMLDGTNWVMNSAGRKSCYVPWVAIDEELRS